MKRITDKAFEYTPSFNTDLRKKFRRIQADQRAADKAKAAQEAADAAEAEAKTIPYPKRARSA